MGDLLSVIHYPHNHANVGIRPLPRSGLLEKPKPPLKPDWEKERASTPFWADNPLASIPTRTGSPLVFLLME